MTATANPKYPNGMYSWLKNQLTVTQAMTSTDMIQMLFMILVYATAGTYRFFIPSSLNSVESSACDPSLPTCFELIFGPFLMTCTSAIAWPWPRPKSSLSHDTISPAFVAESNPLSRAITTKSFGVLPVFCSMLSRYAWNDMPSVYY